MPPKTDAMDSARVEVGATDGDSALRILRRLTDSLGSEHPTSREVDLRENLLTEFTSEIWRHLAAQEFPWISDGQVPETVRLEVKVSSEVPISTVIFAAQRLVSDLRHGIWLEFGDHGAPLHLCHQTVSICI
ncbi:hypothetical protein [Streptomyces sp. NPDC090080]|uniref:hypothetical protein n=1 Tax=Streptomyces sp. NPDC090080 TaxID=3365939 RepID=UPI00382F00C0